LIAAPAEEYEPEAHGSGASARRRAIEGVQEARRRRATSGTRRLRAEGAPASFAEART